jgi:translation initiation factor IF-2
MYMAEEEEKKQEKPKATLIKHRKTQSPQSDEAAAKPKEEEQAPSSAEHEDEERQQSSKEKQEKKKVVVVRKKSKKSARVVAKKSGTGDEKQEAAKTSTPQPSAEPEEKKQEEESRKPEKISKPSAKTPEEIAREQYTEEAEPSGPSQPAQARGTEQTGRTAEGTAPSGGRGGGSRQQTGAREGQKSQEQARGRRAEAPKGGRDTGKRETGKENISAVEQGKKAHGGKKFKTKKKGGYRGKKEEKEKDLQAGKKKQQQQPKKPNPIPKEIDIMEVITVSDLAKKMNVKASELIGKLMNMGMMVTINQQIDAETAEILASEYGCNVNIVSLYDETIIENESDENADLKPRPPIVTVMGHVDHGKTKLLDAIRTTNVVDGEHGGITQHIGAYKVAKENGEIVFLDTPGHEAFTLMRARGAQLTDIVILVVAANDGVMPQTVEAINHAKEAGVPIIVAINKVDLPEANPDRVKQQLSEYDLLPEEWGGGTLFNEISALNHTGIDELMETILLQAEVLELNANYDCRAEGKVLESQVDHGRGIVSTVVIERGTLRVGDAFVAGVYPGKVRAMFNDKGEKVDEATPGDPVEILGFTGIPDAGSPFQVTESERQARQVGDKRQELEKQGEAQNVKKVTLDNLYDSIQQGEIKELKVIIKGDVHGSVEALQTALEKLSTNEIKLNVIHASAGAIIENDVHLAAASNAIIVGFHVRPTPKAQSLAEEEKIDIRKYNVIYEVVDDIKNAMEGMLSPDYQEEVIGNAEVRDTFKVPKIGIIAGCYVTNGKVRRNAQVHLIRDGVEVFTGKINSLKRFKDDVKEVDSGYECGIGIENCNDVRVGDQIEAYEIKEIAKKL